MDHHNLTCHAKNWLVGARTWLSLIMLTDLLRSLAVFKGEVSVSLGLDFVHHLEL
jgi:hypothetical protein